MTAQTRLLAGAIAGVLVLAVSGCGTTGTATNNAGGAGGGDKVVTMYAADGLKTALSGNDTSWFDEQFTAFTKKTGIKVNYVEGGSGEVLNRVEKTKNNPQADILMTLPPFIQKAGDDGLLQKADIANVSAVPANAKAPDGTWTTLVANYMAFLYNDKLVDTPPKTFKDLLDPSYQGKLQYSTPGQAGDGTAFMIATEHAFGSQAKSLDYLAKLETNNVGPSSSTGALTTKVVKGELAVANGDMQLNGLIVQANKSVHIWFPEGSDGKRFTLPLPYAMGLVNGAPHEQNGKKLMNFLLSKEAQQDVSKVSNGLPARDDVHPADANYKTLQKSLQGVEVWRPDYTSIAENLSTVVQKYHQKVGS